MRTLIFPFGLPHRAPSDILGTAVANAVQSAGADRERLLADCYVATDASDTIARADMALALLPAVEAIEKRLKERAMERFPQNLPDAQQWLAAAVAGGVLSGDERDTLAHFARLTDALVQVDDFAPDYAVRAQPAAPEPNLAP